MILGDEDDIELPARADFRYISQNIVERYAIINSVPQILPAKRS